jgi:hypothetical protein
MLARMSERNASASNREEQSGVSAPSNPSSTAPQGDGSRPKRRGPPPNPLYHPLFLPVLLVAYWLWSAVDAFFPSAKMEEHRTFNQILFAILTIVGIWLVPRGIKEFLSDRAAARAKNPDGNSR